MNLRADCLGHVAMNFDQVRACYDVLRHHEFPPTLDEQRAIIKKLCLSHERLRAEIDGQALLLQEEIDKVEKFEWLCSLNMTVQQNSALDQKSWAVLDVDGVITGYGDTPIDAITEAMTFLT